MLIKFCCFDNRMEDINKRLIDNLAKIIRDQRYDEPLLVDCLVDAIRIAAERPQHYKKDTAYIPEKEFKDWRAYGGC